MLEAEQGRPDRLDLVTVATPNATHFEITRAFLAQGFNVLCEKPMTMTVDEGEEIVRISRSTGRICAVNYGYTGYSLVRHMRAMVARGDLGAIRLVVAEFAHGHHADAADADRLVPRQAGEVFEFAGGRIAQCTSSRSSRLWALTSASGSSQATSESSSAKRLIPTALMASSSTRSRGV